MGNTLFWLLPDLYFLLFNSLVMRLLTQFKHTEVMVGWKRNTASTGYIFLIILFMYAGFTKLLERDLFYLNLLNSPILTIENQWAAIASWLIPFMELFVVFLMVYPKTKVKGLYSGIGVLSLYILYILALLFIAPYRPCACGGIIDSFSWEQQLWFTSACLGIAVLTVYLVKRFN